MTPTAARSGSAQLATPLRKITDLRAQVAAWRAMGETVGLVPTMGALHAGHLALVARARAECDRVVATLFVNPKQFDDPADLDSYPADEADDAARFAEAGVDLLFLPAVSEMYPEGFATTVSVGLTDCLCGAARPGHFDGVATVVAKLFNQAPADRAYFGEKDYQQLLVVRRMARDLDLPIDIVTVPTVRAADGLALSSRNRGLTPDQRRVAARLYQTLAALAAKLAGGTPAAPELARGRDDLARAGFDRVDYLDLRDGETLAALDRAAPGARLFAAAELGDIRLIDNISLG
ncbi:MAG: pantoate--beta-alanine ligase [Proteobacteria bacterium]|nr:pantoate--beta-alanine ligase [Pseudomonadota bacterium]